MDEPSEGADDEAVVVTAAATGSDTGNTPTVLDGISGASGSEITPLAAMCETTVDFVGVIVTPDTTAVEGFVPVFA